MFNNPIEAIRTPDERFDNLPGFAFEPKYLDDLQGYEGLRMHYLDLQPAGKAADETFLCLHGEPSWCYLYRKMAPVFLAAGARVVMPDFFGFGRSDKPVDDNVYTFDFHRNMLLRFIERLDLTNITLVVQDWGGLLGLTLPVSIPDRIARLLIMNTTLATGDAPPSKGFEAWKAYVRDTPNLDVGRLMQRAVNGLSDAEAAAYNAPFPDDRAKAGVRRFPAIVPVTPDMPGAEISRKARSYYAESWTKPSFMAVGMQDPVLGPPVMAQLRKLIPGCPQPMQIEEAGHFVQEHGEPIAHAALKAFGITG